MKKKEKMYLILEDIDYADEFMYPVISLISKSQRKKILKKPKKIFANNTYYFGTNEGLELSREEIINIIKNAKPLSKKELKVVMDIGILDSGLDIISQLTDED